MAGVAELDPEKRRVTAIAAEIVGDVARVEAPLRVPGGDCSDHIGSIEWPVGSTVPVF